MDTITRLQKEAYEIAKQENMNLEWYPDQTVKSLSENDQINYACSCLEFRFFTVLDFKKFVVGTNNDERIEIVKRVMEMSNQGRCELLDPKKFQMEYLEAYDIQIRFKTDGTPIYIVPPHIEEESQEYIAKLRAGGWNWIWTDG